ncbi:Sir2 family NAD-dependent protein deacetylase [Actinotignum urinale]|uniref:SIR2 family NAD-dependent protein deacylase n=1 Tax=Actinotignum urinale TaxID=190146 RepID=UPI002A808198|nr:Sir2 family NAD-dependent protein deacetylase [Actinotignum urinale]MDY5129300.1 Sir2 family NAD-dependent protein deacetylase [Actinotignum urinale]
MVITDIEEAATNIADMMRGKVTVAITGAGVSTPSGIPDYRGKGSTQEPTVFYDMFTDDEIWQRWVWQRNEETWRALDSVKPNPGHVALARLEKAGFINGIATQNVDDLHQKAGSRKVAELHGSFLRVDCVDCGATFPRAEIGELLREANPDWPEDPDPKNIAILAGANRRAAENSSFTTIPCPRCGGLIKPSVVFFGESLPGAALTQSIDWAREADVALVVGTSLVVGTGMWVLTSALQNGADCVIINRGRTEGDRFASLRVDCDAAEVLSRVAEILLDE